MSSQKDLPACATARVNVLVGGARATVSEQIADPKKVAWALGELGADAVSKVLGLDLGRGAGLEASRGTFATAVDSRNRPRSTIQAKRERSAESAF